MSEPSTSQAGKFIVGVTGNIATGKSAVMRLAADEGALVIDADKLVHEIMDTDPDMQASLAVAFGSDVRRPNGRIDRKVLGNIVFEDANAMRDLEAMLHPAVYELVTQLIADSEVPLIFIEAIKLLEGRLAQECQQIWVTRCSKQRQLDRLRICRGLETQTAAMRIKSQPPQEDKVALADVVIDTNGYMADTVRQFQQAWDRLPEAVRNYTHSPSKSGTGSVLGTGPALASEPAKSPSLTNLSEGSARLLKVPKPKKRLAKSVGAKATATPTAPAAQPRRRPENLEVRRARPSDIPSIILLVQKATDGRTKMKRADLLMAFSERSYFIGQLGSDVNAIVGWNIDSQVATIDQIFIHPPEATADVTYAIMEEIESSAMDHICEIIVAFLPANCSDELKQVFDLQGYQQIDKEILPAVWQSAIEELQPDDSFFVVKILRDERLQKAQSLQ